MSNNTPTMKDLVEKVFGKEQANDPEIVAFYEDVNKYALIEIAKAQRDACVDYYAARCEKGTYSEWNHEVLSNTPLVITENDRQTEKES